jgi:hypothetical protein
LVLVDPPVMHFRSGLLRTILGAFEVSPD